jgi:hypothetical protein
MIFFSDTVTRYLFLVSISGVICHQIFVFQQDIQLFSLNGAIFFIFSILTKIRNMSYVVKSHSSEKNVTNYLGENIFYFGRDDPENIPIAITWPNFPSDIVYLFLKKLQHKYI